MRILIASAAGLLTLFATPAVAQYYPGICGWTGGDRAGATKAERDYRRDLAEARRECAQELRDADNRREFGEEQRECREEVAYIERDYREALRDHRRDRWDDRRDDQWDDRRSDRDDDDDHDDDDRTRQTRDRR